jgi:phosphoribosylformylglycinamidine synthase
VPVAARDVNGPLGAQAALKRLLGSADLASRRWIVEQYDHMVMGDTVQRPGGDAAVVRIHGTDRGLALTTDCTPRYCAADPVQGGMQAVAEAYRNLCAVGARPLAVTNCLNFGNPQRPEIMAQFVECLRGMGDACRALDFPIVSGNVSLYNESKATGGGSAILPTPAIGGVGLLDDWEKSATIGFKTEGEYIILIGFPEPNRDWLKGRDPASPGRLSDTEYRKVLWSGGFANWGRSLGQSLWLQEIIGRRDGRPPSVDLQRERLAGEFVRELIASNTVTAVHDVSDGGIAVAVAEMALANGIGARVQTYGDHRFDFFCEDQGRYLVTIPEDRFESLHMRAQKLGLKIEAIGETGGNSILLKGDQDNVVGTIPLADLRAAHEGFFPKLMGADAALA